MPLPKPLNITLPGVLPASTPVLGANAARDLATANNIQDFLYSGNPSEIYQAWNNDRREAMRDPAGFLARHARIAQEEDYKAADAVIARMKPAELAAVGPSIRDAYADINARSRGALAGFREIAIKAGLTSPEYSLDQQNEAAVRLMGQIQAADLWEKTSAGDVALDVAALLVTADPNASFFGLIDPERPASFDTALVQRIRRLPAHQQLAAIAAWQDTLIDVHGNFLDLSIQGIAGDLISGTGSTASREAKTNILHVLGNMSSFFDGVEPDTSKIIGYAINAAIGLDAIRGIRAVVRLSGLGGRFGAGVKDSARRAVSRAGRVRTNLTPAPAAEAPRGPAGNAPRTQPLQEASTDASRTAQEAQEGASAQGGATTLPGTETGAATEAPRDPAAAVAAGENPEFQLDVEPGPFTKDDYRNFGTGGDVRQAARDRAAAATGEVQEGARITRRGLQQAAIREQENALANASRDARTPRVGEPVISPEPRQMELPLARPGTRVEPTISPRDPNTPVVNYRNMQDILDEPVVSGPVTGPLRDRAGEPFISEVTAPSVAPDGNEIITGQLGALTLRVPAVAEATGTNLGQVVAHLIPGGEELYPVAPRVGEVITDSLASAGNAKLVSLKEALFASLRDAYSGEQGTLATSKEIKRALGRSTLELRRKIKREIQAVIKRDAEVSVRRTSLRQIGDHTYEVKYKITDNSDAVSAKEARVIGERTKIVVIGADDIREAGDLPDSVLRTSLGVASPKYQFMFNPGRTVDFLVENAEIMLHQKDKYKRIFDSAIREVFSGLTKGETRKVKTAIARSVQLGDGKYIRASVPDLVSGQFRLDNGQALVLSQKEAQAYQKFLDLTEVNAYVLNAMRTGELRSKGVKTFVHPEHGDMYAREIGDNFIYSVDSGDPLRHPAILNLAGAARKDGKVKAVWSWSEFKDNFYDPKGVAHSPYVAVKLEYGLMTSANDKYTLALVNSSDMKEIPEGVPWQANTWIPDVGLGTHHVVVRETFGNINGLEDTVNPIKSRVIARAGSVEEAQLFADSVTRFGNERVTVRPDNVSRWRGDVDYAPVSVIDDEIVAVQNLDIVQQMDPVSAVSRSLSLIADNIPMQAFRRLQKERWATAAKRAKVVASGEYFDDIRIRGDAGDLGTQFERVREYTRRVIGARTDQENLWHKAFSTMAAKLINVAPDVVPRTLFSLADKDPIGWVQTVTMHTQLGFFNPAQLFTQSSNALAAGSLLPKHAIPAVPLASLLSTQSFAGVMADAVTIAERQEYVARLAMKMNMFNSLRESRLFFQKFRNTGLLDNLVNTGDLSEVADASSLHALQDLKQASLFFYNGGVRVERTYAYALAFMNYRDTLIARGDTRAMTDWTSADWNQIFADQQNLTLNMTSVNRAGFQENTLTRLPTQFWQVQGKFLEAAFTGSRMVTGESDKAFAGSRRVAKLMSMQSLMYGAAGIGVPALSYSLYEGMYGSSAEEDAKTDPVTVEQRMVALRGGMASYSLYALTGGTEFSVANRMSILNGVAETLDGVFTGDKPLNEFMLGASKTWLQDVFSGDFLYPAQMLVTDPSDDNLSNFRTGLDVLDSISTVNSAKTALDMYYDHAYRTRSGNTVITDEYSTAEIAVTGIGFRMQSALDLPRVSMDKREIEQDLTNRAKRIAAILNTMAQDPKYREGKAPLLFQARVNEIMGGLPPEMQKQVSVKVTGLLMEQGSQYREFVLDQINPDLYNTTAFRNMRIKAAADRARAEGATDAQP
jgi:hypothetical protein